MKPTGSTIVVGVDGSAGAKEAVRWAAEMAAQRKLDLLVVHGLRVAELYYGGGLAGTASMIDLVRETAVQILDEAKAIAHAVDGDLTIETAMPTESPAPLLIDLSRSARMVVVGQTGHEGFAGMLLGSVATAVAGHAHCPVAVVRTGSDKLPPPKEGPVVLGVDGGTVGEQAIEVAFEEASLRGVPLIAVHAWNDVTYDDTRGATRLPVNRESIEQEERRVLAERLAGWQEKYPDVRVERELVLDTPRHVLLERSSKAQLVVVGSRGLGGFRGMLLGSTSQALVQHANCPVLVVRPQPGT